MTINTEGRSVELCINWIITRHPKREETFPIDLIRNEIHSSHSGVLWEYTSEFHGIDLNRVFLIIRINMNGQLFWHQVIMNPMRWSHWLPKSSFPWSISRHLVSAGYLSNLDFQRIWISGELNWMGILDHVFFYDSQILDMSVNCDNLTHFPLNQKC